MKYKCFDKKASGSGVNNEIKQNHELAAKSHKPIINKKMKKERFIQDSEKIFGVLI